MGEQNGRLDLTSVHRFLSLTALEIPYNLLGLGPVGAPSDPQVPFDVILFNEDLEIMEATIANIAVEVENKDTGALEWITPPASSGTVGRRKGACSFWYVVLVCSFVITFYLHTVKRVALWHYAAQAAGG